MIINENGGDFGFIDSLQYPSRDKRTKNWAICSGCLQCKQQVDNVKIN